MKQPYKIIVIPNLNQEPGADQKAWMFRTMRTLAESALRLGFPTPCVQLLIYPMDAKWGRELPQWAKTWRRPEHCTIEPMRAPYRQPGREDVILHAVLRELADETWCLNGPGHTEGSRCVPAKVWRASRENQRVLPQIKLVPSWVLSDEPIKPAKEKESANGNSRATKKPASRDSGPTTRNGAVWGAYGSGSQGSANRSHTRRRS